MAVEARHLNHFPLRILSNQDLITMNSVDNVNVFGASIGYGVMAPLSATTTGTTQNMVQMFSSAMNEIAPAKPAAMKSDTGLTYAVPVSRKRSRDAMGSLALSSFPSAGQIQAANNCGGSFSFLGQDISYQIHQQQLEIDRFITQHTEKVRIEIEEKRKTYARRIAAAMEENIMKNLKAKEAEIEKIGKLNWALEERVQSLCVENQIWRDLAQTNEATANALRSNLEQVLAQIQDDQLSHPHGGDAAVANDEQSCCGSNFEETDRHVHDTNVSRGRTVAWGDKSCRSCGKEESCVLLLPCRHLCLCTVCGSSLHTCPVCNSIKTASVHVNLSS